LFGNILTNKKITDIISLIVVKKQVKKKPHRFFRLSRVQAYILIKNIRGQLRKQEKRLHIPR